MLCRVASYRGLSALFLLGWAISLPIAHPAEIRHQSLSTKQSPRKLAEDTMRLLHNNCLSCHNAEKSKGGLQLTSREALLKGGDNGPVVAPGEPQESLIFKVLAPDADPHMPPKKQ